MTERYELSRGGEDEPGLILIGDRKLYLIVARSSEMCLKHVSTLVELANKGAGVEEVIQEFYKTQTGELNTPEVGYFVQELLAHLRKAT
jgi:hypothetical protein